MTKDEALRMALEALDSKYILGCGEWRGQQLKAVTAIKQALAALVQQEPVAWMRPSEEGYDSAFRDHSTVVVCTGNSWTGWIPLYTTPPAAQRTWVGLTDVNAVELWQLARHDIVEFTRAIEAAHGIKENT